MRRCVKRGDDFYMLCYCCKTRTCFVFFLLFFLSCIPSMSRVDMSNCNVLFCSVPFMFLMTHYMLFQSVWTAFGEAENLKTLIMSASASGTQFLLSVALRDGMVFMRRISVSMHVCRYNYCQSCKLCTLQHLQHK